MLQKSNPSLSNKIIRVMLAVLATFIGLYPLFYFFQSNFGILGNKNIALTSSTVWSSAFYMHITTGGLALLIGWVQFNEKIRISSPAIHRIFGKMYVLFALCSSISAAYLAVHAEGGVIAATGFLCLAIVWFSSTFMGYTSIVKGQVIQHQKFMIFSYAACFAAVTLRLWLPLLVIISGNFLKAYVVVAWLCWVPNMFAAYFLSKNIGKTENQSI